MKIDDKKVKEITKKAMKWLAIIAIVAILFTIRQTQIIAIVAAMCVLSFSIGRITPTLQNANIGFSFVKLLGMLLMYWYSPIVAALAIPFIQFCEYFGQNYWKTPLIIQLPNRALMPLYGFWILDFNIAWAGLVLLLISDIIEYLGIVVFLGKNAGNSLMYYFTDTLVNFPIIWRIAPLLTQIRL